MSNYNRQKKQMAREPLAPPFKVQKECKGIFIICTYLQTFISTVETQLSRSKLILKSAVTALQVCLPKYLYWRITIKLSHTCKKGLKIFLNQ